MFITHPITHIFTHAKTSYDFSYGEKPIFVPTFSRDSHFGPYLLFSPLLVLV